MQDTDTNKWGGKPRGTLSRVGGGGPKEGLKGKQPGNRVLG